jgi:hypothetical protein
LLDDIDSADDWSRQQFWDWATNVLLVLSISRSRGGGQWWKYMYDVIGVDVAAHIDSRIRELGDSVPPWNELLPHFKYQSEQSARSA